ncbi:YxeA family protein [Lactiplantibacillus paraplantarum]|uniref:YxeA family protein n=1 Tax=Lactiplantibacillus paraplantarum TaxID=60520 RepID=UPI0021A58817|nr:YxeA family protein [Lactiplantibacillus paraplantarum]MCT4455898.1 YxeA family protein [Lactiplantibacillus paraplantarum]
MNKKGVIGLLLVIVMISVGTLLIAPTITKNQGSELAMAVDNLNPLVKVQTVYGRTNSAVSHTTGQMGEDVYTYRVLTSDAQGNQRWLTFTADHRLKQRHYLKIETKGQNVNAWEAVSTTSVPRNAQEVLA